MHFCTVIQTYLCLCAYAHTHLYVYVQTHKHVHFFKHRWDYPLFYSFLFSSTLLLHSKASRKEEIGLLAFILWTFLLDIGPGTLFLCRSPLGASALLQPTCLARLVLPQHHHQLWNSSIRLPAPLAPLSLFPWSYSLSVTSSITALWHCVFPKPIVAATALPFLSFLEWTPVYRRGVGNACLPGWPSPHQWGTWLFFSPTPSPPILHSISS